MASTQKPLSFSLGPLNTKYILDLVAAQKLVNSRYNRSIYMDDLITHLRTKAKPKPKAKNQLVAVEVENLNIKAWDKWIAHRKLVKLKPYKTSLKMEELATLGTHNEQMQIVMISMKNEYAGLFPLKTNNSAANQNILQDSSNSDWHLKEDTGF
ncbi:MAG: hypothetical protein ACI9N9_000328 [Enterobacterales bacterium]|jgi:hypothetical protein